jgi:N-acyl-D-aspartate/D-glutamate deacylase
MAHMFDLIIRGGSVVDGTGSPARTADVAIGEGRVVEVGRVSGSAAREIDADGALVAPGFVDIHTHYDGQATWDPHLTPSAQHGVTTIVMGNCGVGFAPVRPGDHERLIELMEGVEDIPGTALHEGLPWDWNSFAEFLDALERRPHDIDVGTQVPHGPIRLFVMGERGARREAATAGEIAEMGRVAAAAVEAGALGFTTSRTLNHKTSRGEPTPTLTAAREELVGIAAAIGATGRGVLQVVSDFPDLEDEMQTLVAMMDASGRPLSVSLTQVARRGDAYRRILDAITEANGTAGRTMRAQVAARAVGVLVGLNGSINPLAGCPSFRGVADLADPERRPLIAEELRAAPMSLTGRLDRIYVLGDPPNYEPGPSDSVAACAERAGADPVECLLDLLAGDGGRALLYLPVMNYGEGNLDAVGEMLAHPHTVPGLSDGGAHVGTICDGSFPTTLLSWWGRDRPHDRFEVPWLVSQQAQATAAAVGLLDRGVLAPGYKADVNIIDFDSLRVEAPRMVYDLPAGGKRLVQGARGYLHTFVSGVETWQDGVPTGELPGRIIRGGQPCP